MKNRNTLTKFSFFFRTASPDSIVPPTPQCPINLAVVKDSRRVNSLPPNRQGASRQEQ